VSAAAPSPNDRFAERESFIPISREDLIERCLADGKLDAEAQAQFRRFAEILAAYYHFQFHRLSESLKKAYAPFNPDADLWTREYTQSDRDEAEEEVVRVFEELARRANFSEVSEERIEEMFKRETLIKLRTDVNLDEFDRVACFYRGDDFETSTVKKYFGLKKEKVKVDVLQRVLILLKFKDEAYFRERFYAKRGNWNKLFNPDDLPFKPGKFYLSFYRNIPKFDLELIFPNVRLSMTWRDRLLIGIPAIGAAIPTLLRALPQLLLVFAVICFFVMGAEFVEKSLKISSEEINRGFKVMTALLALIVTFGGIAFKQWSSYKNKKIQFQKMVTETLYFRNLANGRGVLHRLVDSAEEEVTKEILLIFYVLITQFEEPCSVETLDQRVEAWLRENLEREVDFDVRSAVENLQAIGRKAGLESAETESLLKIDDQGRCHAPNLSEAARQIDQCWDRFFDYANVKPNPATEPR